MARILITGTSSGFGRLTAVELISRGHHVVAAMRGGDAREDGAAASLHAQTAELPGALDVVDLDVTAAQSVVDGVARALDGGHLDALVNNAGVAAAGITETFTDDDARALFDVNVFGVQRMFRAVLPGMRGRGRGRILTVGSTLGREVTPFLGVYVASKFALEGLIDSYRYELASVGVECSLVQPGTFPTTQMVPNLLQASDPDRAAGYAALHPLIDGFFQGLGDYAASGHAPDPMLVARAVADAIESADPIAPRIVVDPNGPGGAARLNALAEDVQRDVLDGLGLPPSTRDLPDA